jgi:acetylornithine deacetylase
MHPFELTRRLIDIESITGNEKDVALYLKGFLGDAGWTVELQETAPSRFNVWAHRGRPDLVFSTHIDTVPPFIPSREDDEFIHGRGACDAKGILVAQFEAAQRLRAEGIENTGLLFVVGEERDSSGALFANRSPKGSRFIVDGEPTENLLAVGAKGSLRVEITTRGIAAHSAYPHMGESAILKLLDILQDVRGLELPPDPVLGESTCNIGVISGGTRPNVIPADARAEVMFRTVEPVDGLKRRVESLVGTRAAIRYTFEVPIVRTRVVEGIDTTVVAFSSDVPFLTAWGEPCLIGPGSILDAHTDHERISKKQLLEGIDLYVRLVRKLLAS